LGITQKESPHFGGDFFYPKWTSGRSPSGYPPLERVPIVFIHSMYIFLDFRLFIVFRLVFLDYVKTYKNN